MRHDLFKDMKHFLPLMHLPRQMCTGTSEQVPRCEGAWSNDHATEDSNNANGRIGVILYRQNIFHNIFKHCFLSFSIAVPN